MVVEKTVHGENVGLKLELNSLINPPSLGILRELDKVKGMDNNV